MVCLSCSLERLVVEVDCFEDIRIGGGGDAGEISAKTAKFGSPNPRVFVRGEGLKCFCGFCGSYVA